MSLFRLKIKVVTNIYLQPFPNHPFIAIFSLNFVLASALRPRGCIDFERGLINLPFPAGPLPSREGRYLFITPLQNGKLIMEAAL